ncbi:MAG: M6 family metalloprotease domain-containing protein [Candidatus Eiseniibacteriota bacterium]|nr:MAG: M6 family metalloprotease domain-containing protein [Candidatus Eisenbacteria bacterium]
MGRLENSFPRERERPRRSHSGRAARAVRTLLGLALSGTLLAAAFLPGNARAVPLRPDVLEKLRRDRTFLPAPSEMQAAGLNVPLEKFSRDFSAVPEGQVTHLRALVLLIEFPDLPADRVLRGAEYFRKLLFEGTRWQRKTLRSYYLENSYGKLDVTGEVFGWYVAPNSSSYYGSGNAGICAACYPRNARRLAEDAVELANSDVDFSLFDNDGADGVPSSGDDDGYVDAVFIVHSGPSFEETGNPDYILSHQWTTPEPVNVDGVSVYVYAMESERSRIGTFCHELGHVLGLPDLYDTDYDSYALDLWSLMGAGAWGDDGDTPSHLDAWSKTQLGFVEPFVPEKNMQDVVLAPVEDSPQVCKLWKNGRLGREYFLIENRQKNGFDAHLPASGLLIYHVDETVKNNNNQSRYMVALEQADGMYDLERRDPPGPFGADPGDPFPGWANQRNFTNFTVPNTFSNDVRDVEVRVTGISFSQGSASFNVTVETGPELVIKRLLTEDTGPGDTGDGDGNPDRGEIARFRCTLENIGLASGPLTATASCANIYTELLSDTVEYGPLAADEERTPEGAFIFEVDSSLAEDPYRIYFVLDFGDGFFFSRRETVVVAVGDSLGLADGFESGVGNWTHRGVNGIDDWHISSARTFSGDSSWHCGVQDSFVYSDDQDSFLRTPFFISGADARLSFYHWLDVENENSRLAWDGCVVEASSDNVHWDAIEPLGGYPYVVDMRADTDGAGRPCFSGRSKQWQHAEFDLGNYSGALWIRFRMMSDGETSGEGWYIDEVRVSTLDEPYSVAFESVVPYPQEVAISWRVTPRTSGYIGQGITLLRSVADAALSPSADLFEVIHLDTSRSSGVRSFVDTTVAPGAYYVYALSDLKATGESNWIEGPTVYVPHPIHSATLGPCSPNPYLPLQSVLQVSFEVPEGTRGPRSIRATVRVFDVAGRAVAVLHDSSVPSGPHLLTWDGTDSEGRLVASGVYIVSLETPEARYSRKVILLR